MYRKIYDIEGKKLFFDVLDNVSHDRHYGYHNFNKTLKNMDFIILMYSITNKKSFEELDNIYETIKNVKIIFIKIRLEMIFQFYL
jgi:hypothetical protein